MENTQHQHQEEEEEEIEVNYPPKSPVVTNVTLFDRGYLMEKYTSYLHSNKYTPGAPMSPYFLDTWPGWCVFATCASDLNQGYAVHYL
jgi:hypothetical protein